MATATVELERLHERHRGLTEEVARNYAQAAAVCFARRHTSPVTVAARTEGASSGETAMVVPFPTVTKRVLAAWQNRDDATRDGAYGVALAAAESHLGMVAVSRAQLGTGSDYLIGPPGSEVNAIDGELDLENAIRLEVSGIDDGTEQDLLSRLSAKVAQLRRGRSDVDPGAAVVVCFGLLRASFRMAK